MSNEVALNFQVNMTNIAPSGGYVQIPEMPVRGIVRKLIGKPNKNEAGAITAEFMIEITEPGYEGATRRINMRVADATDKGQNARPLWRTALESVGYTPAQLDSGNAVTINPQTFENRTGYFYHRPAPPQAQGTPKEDREFDNLEFCTPTVFADRVKQHAARKAMGMGNGAPPLGGATVNGPTNGVVNPPAPAKPLDTSALAHNLLS